MAGIEHGPAWLFASQLSTSCGRAWTVDTVGLPWPYSWKLLYRQSRVFDGTLQYLDRTSPCQPNPRLGTQLGQAHIVTRGIASTARDPFSNTVHINAPRTQPGDAPESAWRALVPSLLSAGIPRAGPRSADTGHACKP